MSSMVIEGYGAVFGSPSDGLPFEEWVDPHAFDNTLANADNVACLLNHDVNYLLARSKSGTLKLSVDNVGLRYRAEIDPQDSQAVSAWRKVERGDITGSSFAFRVIRDSWSLQEDPPRRTLLEVELTDVSPVVYPCYKAATASARSASTPVAAREGKTISNATADTLATIHGHLDLVRDAVNQLHQVALYGGPAAIGDSHRDAITSIDLAQKAIRSLLDTAKWGAPSGSPLADIDEGMPESDSAPTRSSATLSDARFQLARRERKQRAEETGLRLKRLREVELAGRVLNLMNA